LATATAAPFTERERLLQSRWLILFFSILSMVAVANYQYGWTLFVNPIQKQFGLTTATLVQVTFTVFVLLETWLVPFEGWLVDRFGPRNLVLVGGVVAGSAGTSRPALGISPVSTSRTRSPGSARGSCTARRSGAPSSGSPTTAASPPG
jgi:MFS family permease